MSTKTPPKTGLPPTNFSSGKFLTFKLSDESYGIEVILIKEIVRAQIITPVPGTPAHVSGVTNLRGKVTPVVDLRAMLGFQADDKAERNCLIVVDVEDEKGTSNLLGLIVDSVEEVIGINSFEVDSSPSTGTTGNSELRLGIAKTKCGLINLLDIEKVVTQEISGEFAIS